MTRGVRPVLATAIVVAALVVSTACGAGQGSPPADESATAGPPADDRATSTPPAATAAPATAAAAGTAAAMAKLDPQLAARLPTLPAAEPVRLVATLSPGTPTEPLRARVEALGGQLLQRFTLIEAAVVTVPGANVVALARLSEVQGLELADSGVPPP